MRQCWGRGAGGKFDCNYSRLSVYIMKSYKFKIYLPQIVHESSPSPFPLPSVVLVEGQIVDCGACQI